MQSPWDQFADILDATVDDKLGDRIEYAANGVNFVPIAGFVKTANANLDLSPIDEMTDSRPRVKIAKALVPYPDPAHRLRHPRLGQGTFRPASTLPDDEGRYWIFDVERI
jgi:hypothetical protein